MRVELVCAAMVLGLAACGADEPDDRQAATPRCGPANCGGCCDGNGVCRVPSDLTCGSGGDRCLSCSPNGQICSDEGDRCIAKPAHVCDARTCSGCCDAAGVCRALSDATCGVGGERCSNCAAAGQTCGTSGTCSTPSSGCFDGGECSMFACRCPDGALISASFCLNRSCADQSTTCARACEGHQAPTWYGCALERFSEDFGVTVVLYGAADGQGAASSAALQQCRDAKWTESFCSGGTLRCSSEPKTLHTCTWSKFASSAGRTIYYYGDGQSLTQAKQAAINQCLGSGAWRGWFCSSGSLSCTAQ